MTNKIQILLCFILLQLITSCNESPEFQPQAVRVETSHPQYMTFRNTLRIQGNVEAENYANICARVDGNLDIMKVDKGDKVKKGQTLFQVDKENLEHEVKVSINNCNVEKMILEKAKLDYQIQKIKTESAREDYLRAKTLVKKHAVSESYYEDMLHDYSSSKSRLKLAKTNVKHSEISLERAENNLRIAQKKLADSKITASYPGVITKTFHETDEYVKKGDCVVRLEELDRLNVTAYINSEYYSQIRKNKTEANIYSLNGKKIVKTYITYKSPNIDTTTRNFEIELILPEQKKLVSGMLCNIEVILSEKKAYGVPEDAVIMRSGGKTSIFIAKKSKAVEKNVRTGLIYRGYIELTGKIKPNINVITKGQAFLNDGTRIKVMNKQNNKHEKTDNVSK